MTTEKKKAGSFFSEPAHHCRKEQLKAGLTSPVHPIAESRASKPQSVINAEDRLTTSENTEACHTASRHHPRPTLPRNTLTPRLLLLLSLRLLALRQPRRLHLAVAVFYRGG